METLADKLNSYENNYWILPNIEKSSYKISSNDGCAYARAHDIFAIRSIYYKYP